MNELMRRRRALMGQKGDILWEWTPAQGLSNITLTASIGYSPSYELFPDCIRLKGPHATDLKQTNIVMSNPPTVPEKFWVEASIKNFPINGTPSNSVGVYLRGNIVGSVIYGKITGAEASTYRDVIIRGANTITQKWTSMPTEFEFKMLVDKSNNSATAYFPNGVILTEALGGDGYNPWIVSIESRAAGYFDVTRLAIRRA